MRLFHGTLISLGMSCASICAAASVCTIPEYVTKNHDHDGKELCVCPDSVSADQSSYHVPRSYRMVAVCGYEYFYEGRRRIAGEIVREDEGEVMGDMTVFVSRDLETLRLDPDEIDHSQKIRIPVLTPQTICWTAPAVIELDRFFIDQSDTDNGGTYPTSYRFIKVGKFHACKAARQGEQNDPITR